MGIALENVSFTYQEGTPLASAALSDVSLTIEDGSYTALIGHTGSGKSTILQLLNGLLVPSQGSVRVFDTLITSTSKNKDIRQIRKQVGLVFQFAENQIFEETVLKDVAFGPQNFGVSEEDAEKIAREKLALVGIDESLLNRSPFELSGGQMRRVAIAGILAMEPAVLVLDEPTAGLDPLGRKELMNLFKKLHQSGMTIVLVTHLMDDVAEYANQVYVMEKGRLVKGGKPSDVFQDVVFMEEVQLGVPKITAFCKRLADRGVSFKRLPIKIEEFKESLNG
ncbi:MULTISPECIES: energy-coupling factor transporter ATPase [Streptococcus]|uniref:Energy-coupling factor transporter ATP-binding protein EcfA2 n=1 Tax=Streptococcus pseudopneumoniae TaxID=257758 RepID=A0ABX9PAE6_9STRE|nr:MULTISPECIES: energy-coupling factor transporter ATPase [Streptococcus]ETE00546.1 cobalt ABC transporter ATP-binding protein [Streptococcus pseudopneumoniae 5247]MBW8098784.1 energy-coupling factor transporter ATPase [Streptococcus pseudopneumoniae]RJQ64434.1 energy-coupling factor transporter ATPase [Streptococcus pseudopneumoniae]RJY11864.1 energy-coupling factor transporter ATPase [Streptococcus pseudopneumoniae]CEY35283.1 cobalt ABC transporter ATP-binding protein [Streptococcus pneumon